MITTDDMTEEALRRFLTQRSHHGVEDRSDGEEALVGGTDVLEAHVVEEDLLDDEGGDGLGELTADLHDAEAEGNDLCLEQKVDDLGVVHLDEGTDDAQAGEAEVLEGPGGGGGVEKRVQIKWDMGVEKRSARVLVAGETLQQGQGIADTVGGVRF